MEGILMLGFSENEADMECWSFEYARDGRVRRWNVKFPFFSLRRFFLFASFILLISLLPGLNSFSQTRPAIAWQKCIGGTGDEQGMEIIRTKDGGYFVVGFTNSTNGDVRNNHGGTDGWVIRLSKSGEIEWQKCYGGTADDFLISAKLLPDGSLVCSGTTRSNDGDIQGKYPGSSADLWLLKINSNGEIIWSTCFSQGFDLTAHSLTQTPGGSFIVSCYNTIGFYRNMLVKFDPSGQKQGSLTDNSRYETLPGWPISMDPKTGKLAIGVNKKYQSKYNITPVPYSWIVKLDTGLLNQDNMYDFNTVDFTGMYVDQLSEYMGFLSDLYCSPSNDFLTKERYVYCVFNVVFGWWDFRRAGLGCGNILLMDTILNPVTPAVMCQTYTRITPSIMHFALNANTSGYMLGSYTDYPLGPGYHSRRDGLVADLQNEKFCYGGSGDEVFNSIAFAEGNNAVYCGTTNSADGDVTGQHGGFDIWVVKIGALNKLEGSVFLDQNNNGTQEPGEPYYKRGMVMIEKDGFNSAIIPTDGQFETALDSGTYRIKFQPDHPYYTVQPENQQYQFSGYNNTQTVRIALSPVSGKRDYRVSLIPAAVVAEVGKPAVYKLVCQNLGTDTLVSGQLKLKLDGKIFFVSATPAVVSRLHDTLSWNIEGIPPQGEWTALVHAVLAPTPDLKNGDTLFSFAKIPVEGDLNPSDNYSGLRQFAAAGSLANGKSERNGNFTSAEELNSGNGLVYTLYFRNTLQDTLRSLVISDTLDTALDPASLEMVSSSHTFELSVEDGNVCKWSSVQISLPPFLNDSARGEGYISFRINSKPGLKRGDSISNRAWFNLNYSAPLPTNIIVTSLKAPPPVSPIVIGLRPTYCNQDDTILGRITNLPPPENETYCTVMLDSLVLKLNADTSFGCAISKLKAGVHTMVVNFRNYSGSSASVSNLEVINFSTQEVKLSSNINTITHLSIPILLNAENIMGGGLDPRFVFGWDRNFDHIIQKESGNTTCTISPRLFKMGYNWVYAGMKSSDSCVSPALAIDSIKIEKQGLFGITDPDNPNKIIEVYPNPFKSTIYIVGLDPLKTYTLTIHNNLGQEINRRSIWGSSEISIYIGQPGRGMYQLSIFDNTRSKFIGALKIMRE